MPLSSQLGFRKIAALIAAAGTLFWLYTFYAIAHVPIGDGTVSNGSRSSRSA
ncbi:hypothetical protein [Bradyrhizobium sp. Ec3.3]|uniref:hypothetical protein n=1 Tax=Bradyrhizobium sp. Ec3.3 TaxID=189753 RepID=UPI00042505E7|nr:hypothetical protein [Bradyrhizobium sp. Ec3.3]